MTFDNFMQCGFVLTLLTMFTMAAMSAVAEVIQLCKRNSEWVPCLLLTGFCLFIGVSGMYFIHVKHSERSKMPSFSLETRIRVMERWILESKDLVDREIAFVQMNWASENFDANRFLLARERLLSVGVDGREREKSE